MLKIRLTRMRQKESFYRIVVIDSRLSRSGVPTDTIGYYDPSKSDTVVKVDEEKALAGWAREHSRPIQSVQF